MCEAHGVRGDTCGASFCLLSLLEERFVDRVNTLLLLLVLGDLLRPNDAVQLVYLVHMGRLLVVEVLIEGRHGMLHVQGELVAARAAHALPTHANGSIHLVVAHVGSLLRNDGLLMVCSEALLGHEVLVEVIGGRPTANTLVHRGGKRGPPLLLRDRPLVKIARLEEFVDGGEPVLLRRLFVLAGVLLSLHLDLVNGLIVDALLPEGRGLLSVRGALRYTVSHLLNVRSEFLSRPDLERSTHVGRLICYPKAHIPELPVKRIGHLVRGVLLIRLAHLIVGTALPLAFLVRKRAHFLDSIEYFAI